MIVCNFKSFMNLDDVNNFNLDKDIIVCPSFIHIQKFLDKNYKVGMQDVSAFQNGPYTGEVSARQAYEMGVKYVLIGHHDLKNKYTLEDIKNKLKISLKENLKVILCVNDNNGSKKNIEKYLITVLDGINSIENIIIAYEPVWSIGTGITPTNEQIEAAIDFIQTLIYKKYQKNVKVLYGGSVNDKNINTLKNIKNVSGFLIGKASTDCKEMKNIIDNLK